MICSKTDKGKLHCGSVNYFERMCFCRFDDVCDIRPINGTQCMDSNECNIDNGGCEHECINTEGSYRCNCKAGLKLAPDMSSCIG